jgi:hypothetical protein
MDESLVGQPWRAALGRQWGVQIGPDLRALRLLKPFMHYDTILRFVTVLYPPPSSAETLRSVAQGARAGLPEIIVLAATLYLHRLIGAKDLVLGPPVHMSHATRQPERLKVGNPHLRMTLFFQPNSRRTVRLRRASPQRRVSRCLFSGRPGNLSWL